MFGLGLSELIMLGVLALLLIGPKQLPEVARTLGRFINDLKRSAEGLTDDIKKQAKVDLDLDSLDPRKKKTKSLEEKVPTYNYEDMIKPESKSDDEKKS